MLLSASFPTQALHGGRTAGCVCPVIKYDFSIFLRNCVLVNFSFGVEPACGVALKDTFSVPYRFTYAHFI